MRAYVDESVHVHAPGLYVLAAVVVRRDAAEQVRVLLRESVSHRRQRFHWRDEEQGDREAMAKMVGGLELQSVVAVVSPVDRRRPERGRRRCLTRLLWELQERQVFDVLLESRTHLDKLDREHIAGAQRAKHVAELLRYDFERPSVEPLLWLPDLVAGAVAAARVGLDVGCLEALGPQVTVVDAGDGT